MESERLLLRNLCVLQGLGSNRVVFPVEMSALRYFAIFGSVTQGIGPNAEHCGSSSPEEVKTKFK